MSWMAQEKTNYLKIQFLGCTIYMLWCPLVSLLIHHPGPHLLPVASCAAAPARAQVQPCLGQPLSHLQAQQSHAATRASPGTLATSASGFEKIHL